MNSEKQGPELIRDPKVIQDTMRNLGEEKPRDRITRAIENDAPDVPQRAVGPEGDPYDITMQEPETVDFSNMKQTESIAENPDVNPELLHQLALNSEYSSVMWRLAKNPSILGKTIDYFLDNSKNPDIFWQLHDKKLKQGSLSIDQIKKLWSKRSLIKRSGKDLFAPFILSDLTSSVVFGEMIGEDKTIIETVNNYGDDLRRKFLTHPNLSSDLIAILLNLKKEDKKDGYDRYKYNLEGIEANLNWVEPEDKS